jgi:putative transposase
MSYTKKKDNVAYKAYHYECYPTEKQKVLINKTFGCVRFIYNHLLSDRTAYYKETGETLKKEVSEYKKDYSFLKEVDSSALANAKLNLERAFSNFFNKSLKAKYPQFHKKGRNDSYTTNRTSDKKGHSNIRIEEDGIRLPKLDVVKTKLHRSIGDNEIIKSVTVSRKANRYFLSVLVEYYPQDVDMVKPTINSKVIGLDYSSPLFYVDSNGYSPSETKYFRKAQKQLAKAQRRLSKKQFKSKNYNKQKIKVQKIHLHISNQRKDFSYKEANKLTNEYDIICFEDLNLANLSRTLHLGKSTYDNGFGFFRTIVEQKCSQKGKLFIKVNKWFPSSKTCHCCGYINKDLTLNDREWVCPQCHSIVSRDKNAAMNIRDEGLKLALAL